MPERFDLANAELFIDLTTTTHATGRTAGSTRVEWQFARHVAARTEGPVHFVSWSSAHDEFTLLPPLAGEALDSGDAMRVSGLSGTPITDASSVPPGRPRRILLVTGAGWLSNAPCLHGLRRLRRRLGAELFVIVHDVVHLKFPHWFPRGEAIRLGSNMAAMLSSADTLLTYSRSTAADIEAMSRRYGIPHGPLRMMALGADLPASTTPADMLTAPSWLQGRPFVLYVSTLAYRKNHELIYNVWARLARELGDALPLLLMIGQVAPGQELLVDRIRRDPDAADCVHVISGVDDQLLGWLYRHCAFTVFPSRYEGWGLPVAESLAHGKVVVASNVSSLPELAGECTPLLDPLDFTAWCDTIRLLVTEPPRLAAAERRVRETYRPTTWTDAASSLMAVLTDPAVTSRDAPVRSAADAGIGWTVATQSGWAAPRTDGARVTTGADGRLGLLIDSVPPHGLRLWLSVSAASPDVSHAEVYVTDVPTDAWTPAVVTGDDVPPARAIVIGPAALRQRGLLDLRLQAVTAGTAWDGESERPALRLHGLRLEPLTREEWDAVESTERVRWALQREIAFNAGGHGVPLLQEGWDVPATWGVWSVGSEASLRFLPSPRAERTMHVRLTLRAFVWPQAPTLDVHVLANGRHIDTWLFEHGRDTPRTDRYLTLPWVPGDGEAVTLTFRIPDCRAPRDIGLGPDERPLGLGLVRAIWTLEPQAQRTTPQLTGIPGEPTV